MWNRRVLLNLVLPLVLLLAIVVSGTLSLYLAPLIHNRFIDAGLSLVEIGIVLLGLTDEDNNKLIYLMIGLGLIADWYYFGFIGVYAVLFPVTLFVAQKITRYLPESFFSYLLITILFLLSWQIYIFGLLNLFSLVNVSLKLFLINSVPATLLIGIVLYFLTFGFWIWLIKKYPFYK